MVDHRKTRSVWFIAGISLGALTGMLLAPQSGRETRKAMAARVNEGVQHAAALGRNTRRYVNNIVDSGKKTLVHKKEQVEAVIGAVKARLNRAA